VEPERRKLRGRILLVEDNPVNLLVAQRLLGVLGLDCDTATNGEAALLRMHDGNYDMVLIDCQMPILDGYTATRRWREHEAADPSGPRLPIIAMTANAMKGDRERLLSVGMNDYVAKPIEKAQLFHALARATGDNAALAAAPQPTTESTPDAPPAVSASADNAMQQMLQSLESLTGTDA
jgi:CheY-like chemotaxis protein